MKRNPTTVPSQTGVYTCTFSNATTLPTEYEIKIHMAQSVGIPTIIGVPLAGAPMDVWLNEVQMIVDEVPDENMDTKSNLDDLLITTEPHAWAHEPNAGQGTLFFKTTTILEDLLNHSIEREGTKNYIYIDRTPPQ